LKEIDCWSNSITHLDISNNIALEGLYSTINDLATLDVSDNKNLKYLDCSNNQLMSLNISKNINLGYLSCGSNKIQTICVNSLNQVKPDWQKDASATYKVCN
jgi:Leucine-rich repeat (LRR) protein